MKEITEKNYQEALKLIWERAHEATIGSEFGEFQNVELLGQIRNHNNNWLNLLQDIKQTSNGDEQGYSLGDLISDLQTELATLGYKLDKTDNFDFSDLLAQYLQSEIYKRSRFDEQFKNNKNEVAVPDWILEQEKIEQQSSQDSTPLFSEVYESFLEFKVDKKKLSDKMQKDYARYYSDWSAFNVDKKIGSITKKEIKEFLKACLGMPKRNVKDYKKSSFIELLDRDIPEDDLVAPKTVDQVRKWLQGVFAFARDELEVVDTSAATDLKMDLSKSNSYGSYKDEEINVMLEALNEKGVPLWAKMIINLAVFTGARRGELVQLKRENIKTDPDSKRLYIMITDKDIDQSVKKESSVRQVPIHPKLEEMGFLEFIKNKESRIFDELKPAKVTSWFGGFRDRCGIDKQDDFQAARVFHSFRHTFISKTLAKNNSREKVQQVVGHEKGKTDITDRYTHRFPIKDLTSVVDLVTFD